MIDRCVRVMSVGLLLAVGCDLGAGRVSTIDYDYFHLKTSEKPDGAIVLEFTYHGPEVLQNVEMFPYIFLARESLAWRPDPVWQKFDRWDPQETKTIVTDAAFLGKIETNGVRIPIVSIKLILGAERDGKKVYVTKEFKASRQSASGKVDWTMLNAAAQ